MTKFSKNTVGRVMAIAPLAAMGTMAANGTGLTGAVLDATSNVTVFGKMNLFSKDLLQQVKTLTGPVTAHAVGTDRRLTGNDWTQKNGKLYIKTGNFGIDKNSIASFAWGLGGSTNVEVIHGAKFQLLADTDINGAIPGVAPSGSGGYQYSGPTLQGQMNWLSGWNGVLPSAGLGYALDGLRGSTNGSSADMDPNTTTYTSNPGDSYRLTNIGRMLGNGKTLADADGDKLDMIVTIISANPGIKTSLGFGWGTAEGGGSGSLPGSVAGSWNPAIAFGKTSSFGAGDGLGIYNLYTSDANMDIKFVKAGTNDEVKVSSVGIFSDIDATQMMYENFSTAAIGNMGSDLSIDGGGVVHTTSSTDDPSNDPRNAYVGVAKDVSSFNYHYIQQNTRDQEKKRGLFTQDGIMSTLFGKMSTFDILTKEALPNPNQPVIDKNVLNKNSVNSDTDRPADIALSSSKRNTGKANTYLGEHYYGSNSDDYQSAGTGTDYSNDEGWVSTQLNQSSKDDDIKNSDIEYSVNAYLDESWLQNNITFDPVLHYTDDLASHSLKAVSAEIRANDGTVTNVSKDAIKDDGGRIDYTLHGQKPGDYTIIIHAKPTGYQVKYPNTAKVSVDFTQKYDDGSLADDEWHQSGGKDKPQWSGNLIETNMVQIFPRVPVPNAPDVVKNVSGKDVSAANGYSLDSYNHKGDDQIDSTRSYEGFFGQEGQATTFGNQIIWTPQINFDNTWEYSDNSGVHSYNPQIHLNDTIQDGLKIESIEVLVNGVSKGFLPDSAMSGNKIDYVWDGTGVPANSNVKFRVTTTVTDAWSGKFEDTAKLSVDSLRNVPGYTDGRSEAKDGKEQNTMSTPDSFKNLETNKVSVISNQQPEEPVKNVFPTANKDEQDSTISKLSGYNKYTHKSDDNLNTAEGVLQRRDGKYEWVITQYLNDYSKAEGTTLSMDVLDDISGNGRLQVAGDAYVFAGKSNSESGLTKTTDGLAQPSLETTGEVNNRNYHIKGIDNKTRSIEIHIPVQLVDRSSYVTDLSMMGNEAKTKVTVDSLPSRFPGATNENKTNKVGVIIPPTDVIKNVAQVDSQNPAGDKVADQNTRYTIGANDGSVIIPDDKVWQDGKANAGETKQHGSGYFDGKSIDLTASNTRPHLIWALDQQLGSGSDSDGSREWLNEALTINDVLDPEVALGTLDDSGNFIAGSSNDGKSVIVYGVKADGSKEDQTANFDVKVSAANGDSITGGDHNNNDFAGQPLNKISQQRVDMTAKDARAFRQNYVAYHVEVSTVAHGGKISQYKIGNDFTSHIVYPAFNNIYKSNHIIVDRPKVKDSLTPSKVGQSSKNFGNRQYMKSGELGEVTDRVNADANDVAGFGDQTLENPNDVVTYWAGANVPADRTQNYKGFSISDDVNAAFEEQSVVGVYDVTEAMKQAKNDGKSTEDLTALLTQMYKHGNLTKSGSGVHDVSSYFDLTANGQSIDYGSLQNPSSNKPISWSVAAKSDVLTKDSFYEDGLYIQKGGANHMFNMNPLNGRYYFMLVNAQPSGHNNSTLDIPNQGKVVVDGGDNPSTKYTPWTVTHVEPPKTPTVSKATADKADAVDAQTVDGSGELISGTSKDKSSGIVFSHEDALRGDEDTTTKNTLASTKETSRATMNYFVPDMYDNVFTQFSGDDHNFRVQSLDGQFNEKADITITGTSAVTKIGGLTIDLTADRSQAALALAKMATGHYVVQGIYTDESNNGKYGDPIAVQMIPLPEGWDKYDDGQKADFLKLYDDNLKKQLTSDGTDRKWANIKKNVGFKISTWDSNKIKVSGNTPAERIKSVLKTDAGKAVMSYMDYLDKHKQKTSVVNIRDFNPTGDNAGATIVASDNVLYYGSPFYGTTIQQLFDWHYNGNNTEDTVVRDTGVMTINDQTTESNFVDTVVPKVKTPSVTKSEAPTTKASIVNDKSGTYLDNHAVDATPDSKADGTEDMTVGRNEKYSYGFHAVVPGSNISGFSIKDTKFKADVLNNPESMRVLLGDGTDVSSDFNFGYDDNGRPYAATKSPKIARTYQGVDVWLALDGVSIKKDADLSKYADKNKAGSITGYTIPDVGALEYSSVDKKNPSNNYDPKDPDRSVQSNQVNVHLYRPLDPQKFVSVDKGKNWDQGTEKLKDHGDSFWWKSVYGNVNTKYLSNISLVDYVESVQQAKDVRVLYTSNDGKIKDKDITDQGTIKTAVVNSPLVKGAKVVKYSWFLKNDVQIDGDLQLVVENSTLGEPSATEVPYLVNKGKSALGFGEDKTVIKIPNISEENFKDETGDNVSKKTNVPMVEVPDSNIPTVLQKSVSVLDGGATAINGQAYLTGDKDASNTAQAGKVTAEGVVSIVDPVGTLRTVNLGSLNLTKAYNEALLTNNLTQDAMKAALQSVVDKAAKNKGYVAGKMLSNGEKVASVSFGPLTIVSAEDQANTDRNGAVGQAKDLKLVGGSQSALSLDEAKKAGTYWSVAVYDTAMKPTDKPLSQFVVTGKDAEELRINLKKTMEDKKYSDTSKYQVYIQEVVTKEDGSQKMKSLTEVKAVNQKITYTLTEVTGQVSHKYLNATYPIFDNHDNWSSVQLNELANKTGRQALENKLGYISWDSGSMKDGTLNEGGFIHVDDWGTPKS